MSSGTETIDISAAGQDLKTVANSVGAIRESMSGKLRLQPFEAVVLASR
jgi:hypothetical protein